MTEQFLNSPADQAQANRALSLCVILLLGLYLGYIGLNRYYGLNSDPASGFLALMHWQGGGSFNTIEEINRADITGSSEVFLSWWTPGQYLVPWLFAEAFGITLASAAKVATGLAFVIGAWGYYVLFRVLGFRSGCALFSVLLLLLNAEVFKFLPQYCGGGPLLWGAFPWIVRLFISGMQRKQLRLVVFVLVGFAGFFLKSSFTVSYLGLLLGAFLYSMTDTLKEKYGKGTTLRGLGAEILSPQVRATVFACGIAAFVTLVSIQFGFNSRGAVPLQSRQGFLFSIGEVFFAFAGAFNGLLAYSRWPAQLSQATGTHLLFSVATVLLFVWSVRYRWHTHRLALCLALGVTLISTVFFAGVYLFRASISHDSRHFLQVTALMVPLLVEYLSSLRVKMRVISQAVLVILCTVGVVSMLYRSQVYRQPAPRGTGGFVQRMIDEETLHKVRSLDADAVDTPMIFYFTRDELRMVPQTARTASRFMHFEDPLHYPEYHGSVAALYLVMNKRAGAAKRDAALRESFKDYSSFEVVFENEHHRIWKGIVESSVVESQD